jgi:cytokinin riboside 5'-monophosphate phosphoribohydrolase
VREGGGRVTGVIPSKLAPRELSGELGAGTIVVETMHERKALMASHADAFLALPGGVGTLEELLEMGTWLQLGMSAKPVGILNVEGYYTGLLAQLATASSEGFTSGNTIFTVESGVCELLDALEREAAARTPAAPLSDLAK